MGSQVRKARLAAIRRLTVDTNEYRLAMVEPQALPFRAGQFVSLACGVDAEGNLARRSYSIASSSRNPEMLALVVKLLPGGLGSDFFASLAIGTEIELTGPMGFFVLELSHPGDIVLAATGTGLAPIIPMLYELAARPSERERAVHLFWGLRSTDDLFYREEIEQAASGLPNFRQKLCVTQPPAGWAEGYTGRITKPVLEAAEALRRPTFYLVGNGAMIRELSALLQARGVDRKRQIRTEAFFK